LSIGIRRWTTTDRGPSCCRSAAVVDVSTHGVFAFAGHRYDRMVAVMERIGAMNVRP
jgi:hypothetical protein